MVRGTYLPLPSARFVLVLELGGGGGVESTSLGEEGAEALIRIGGLSLFGEETVRLEEESVLLRVGQVVLSLTWIPCSRQ